MQEQFDVVIIGAGMVGASFACALLDKQPALKLALVEAFSLNHPVQAPSSYDARSTALARGSADIYTRMGLWDQLAPSATAINSIQVSDRHYPAAARLSRQSAGEEQLGFVIENRQLGNVLLDRILASDQIKCMAPARVTGLRPTPGGPIVCVEQGGRNQEIHSELVVIAEGTESKLREQLGIRVSYQAYDQQAIIANVSVDRANEGIAYERFTEQGPIALLPLAENSGDSYRFAMVFNSSQAESDEWMQLPDADFIKRLQHRFGYRAGRIVKLGERATYALAQSRTTEQVRSGFVILGNAAHTMHPVAGQGFNLSLRDADCLAEHLVAARNRAESLGSLEVLERYVSDRQMDQALVQQFTHGVVGLFMKKQMLPRMFRQAGLITMDLMPALKHEFVKYAAGLKAGAR
jgi:2-polyprenyl-6-methoxyphenol 4-hydroxylase